MNNAVKIYINEQPIAEQFLVISVFVYLYLYF
jgi:hypothetical protein